MTVLIAVLLAFILIAMVSSNKDAAAGVWRVLQTVLWGALFLFCWLMFVVYWVWLEEAYPTTHGEWWTTIGLVVAVAWPPIAIWLTRKDIYAAYKKDKRQTIKRGLILGGQIIFVMVAIVLGREFHTNYPGWGWSFVLVPLVLLAMILVFRSLSEPSAWREIWFGPQELPEVWMVIESERERLNSELQGDRDRFEKNDMTTEELEEWRTSYDAKVKEHREYLDELEVRLISERQARAIESQKISVRGLFWFFLIFAAFGLVGIMWDVGFEYAITLPFVGGEVWAAGTIVVLGFIFVGAILFGIGEAVYEQIKAASDKQTAAHS